MRRSTSLSVWIVALLLVSACGGPPTSPDPAASSPASPVTSPAPTASLPPAPTGKATFKVRHRSRTLGGSIVPISIYDRTGEMKAARRAKDRDQSPPIESRLQPRLGADPSIRRDLRVLWIGGICDSTYTVEVTLNAAGGYHVDVRQGPYLSGNCDTLAVQRGVVLKFKSRVDASIATGTFVSAVP